MEQRERFTTYLKELSLSTGESTNPESIGIKKNSKKYLFEIFLNQIIQNLIQQLLSTDIRQNFSFQYNLLIEFIFHRHLIE